MAKKISRTLQSPSPSSRKRQIKKKWKIEKDRASWKKENVRRDRTHSNRSLIRRGKRHSRLYSPLVRRLRKTQQKAKKNVKTVNKGRGKKFGKGFRTFFPVKVRRVLACFFVLRLDVDICVANLFAVRRGRLPKEKTFFLLARRVKMKRKSVLVLCCFLLDVLFYAKRRKAIPTPRYYMLHPHVV